MAPLFGREKGKTLPRTNWDRKVEPADERERLLRQLEQERGQRLEDVHKERKERLAAEQRSRRLQKELSRRDDEIQELRLLLARTAPRENGERFWRWLLRTKS